MRRSDRTASHVKARIITGGQQDTAYIAAIAHGGLKLAGIGTLGVGDIIEVHAGADSVQVEIIWTHAMQCGARFLPDARPEAVSRFRAACMQTRSRLQDDDTPLRAGRNPTPAMRRPKCAPPR